jgi:hypothetical protein
MAGYLGTLLVERGVLSAAQVEEVLERQRKTGQPFGLAAVEMFAVRMADVWRALAVQQRDALPHVDLEELPAPEERALALVPARMAWAGKVLPLRLDESPAGTTLVCASTRRQLADAMALLHESIDQPIAFVLADDLQLKQHIMAAYPAAASAHAGG